ncbi:MAG: prolyl oligopeptidase family serine peptidase [Candidatus Nanopelagicales bacterium]|nr:prolyl oligopeptidase family serine peptidase [Candidatus Nanopelagicales bacterium]
MSPRTEARRRGAVVGIFLLALSLLFLVGCAKTQEQESVKLDDPSGKPLRISGKQALTNDDILDRESYSEFRMSPDGSTVAWVKDGGELFLVDFASGASRQVTPKGVSSISQVAWSPDGKRLAFMSDSKGLPQAWFLDVSKGSASSVSSARNGITGLSWSASDAILYTAPGRTKGGDPNDHTYEVTDYSDTPTRLFRVDLAGGKTTRLTNNHDRLISISGSPDGRYAFYTRTKSANDLYPAQWQQTIPFENYLLDLKTGRETKVFAESRWLMGGGLWSPDSKTLFVVDFYSDDEILANYLTIPRVLDVQTGAELEPDLGWERGIDQMSSFLYGALVPFEGGFMTLLADGTNPIAAKYARSGSTWEREDLDSDHQGNIFALDASHDGEKIVYTYGTANTPDQLYLANVKGDRLEKTRVITDLNRYLKKKNLGRTEVMSWVGAEGEEVQGLLSYPNGYEPGKRYPMVFIIHGGPTMAVTDRYMDNPYEAPHLMAQKGAFVLRPNYHGSLNYGLPFQKSLLGGHYYDYPLEDFYTAVDRLDELGFIDPNRLGTLGWSNGAILSVALIAKGDARFKAASAGAGGGEWVSDWGGSLFGGVFGQYWFKDPVKDPEYFINPDNAPFYNSEKVVTPTIFYGGDKDQNVPLAMTLNTFRGIQQYGKVPVKMFIFPGEKHALESPAHLRRKLVEDNAWFDKYFFGSGDR